MTQTHPLAADILSAFETGQRVSVHHSVTEITDAYRVQQAVAAQRGPVAGFKTGRKPGEVPFAAPIMASGLCESGAQVRSQFGGPLGIELEVGLRLRAPLPEPNDPAFVSALRDCIEPVAVIELVDTRLSGPEVEDPLIKLADAQINAGLVVGPVMRGWDGGALARVTAKMRAGDRTLVDGPADIPGGDVRESLRALAAMLGTHCGGLQVGQIVITGTLHPLTYVAAGTRVEGWIAGFGQISVTVG